MTELLVERATIRAADRLGCAARGVAHVLTEQDRAAAFERVALPHLQSAFRLARWLARNPHDAEDVLQEAYLRAFRYFESFSGTDARTWLLSIVRNTFHDYRRKHPLSATDGEVDARELSVDGGDAVVAGRREASPEQRLAQAAERARIDAAILALPIEFREVIVLRELEELSYKEIASVVRIPIGTVMSRLSRGREDLRRLLKSGDGGGGNG